MLPFKFLLLLIYFPYYTIIVSDNKADDPIRMFLVIELLFTSRINVVLDVFTVTNNEVSGSVFVISCNNCESEFITVSSINESVFVIALWQSERVSTTFTGE